MISNHFIRISSSVLFILLIPIFLACSSQNRDRKQEYHEDMSGNQLEDNEGRMDFDLLYPLDASHLESSDLFTQGMDGDMHVDSMTDLDMIVRVDMREIEQTDAGHGEILPTKLVSGAYATCLTRATQTQCWGKINDVTYTSTAPLQTSPAWVDMAISRKHICGILADGHVGCMGSNHAGQLARDTIGEDFPFAVINGLSHVTSVCVGTSHSCVVANQGRVYCWGNNGNGQLGRPIRTGLAGPLNPESTPLPVLGLSPATQVACGQSYSCALLEDKTVRCWGSDQVEQVGNTVFETNEMGVALYDIGLTELKSIVAENDSSCVLSRSGEVYCWGRYTPFSPSAEDYDLCTNVAPVACHQNPTLIELDFVVNKVTLSNQLCVLGERSEGDSASDSEIHSLLHCQGLGLSADWNYQTIPELFNQEVTDIALGKQHMCILLSDEMVLCIGDGRRGQLGIETEYEFDWVNVEL